MLKAMIKKKKWKITKIECLQMENWFVKPWVIFFYSKDIFTEKNWGFLPTIWSFPRDHWRIA